MDPSAQKISKPVKDIVKSSNIPQAESQHTNSSIIINHLTTLPENISALADLRIFYVFVGLSAAIILCFVIRALRFRTKKSTRIRRYGVKTARGDVEMMPLDNEDDDEDATVFDVTDHSVPQP